MKTLKLTPIILSLTIAAFILGGVFTASVSAVSSLGQRLAGRILLQVESKGEAWYVDPLNFQRHYLGRAQDCFDIMRKKGLGINNKDLEQIEKAGDSKLPDYTTNWQEDDRLSTISFKYPENLSFSNYTPFLPSCAIDKSTCYQSVSLILEGATSLIPSYLTVDESQYPFTADRSTDYIYKIAKSQNSLITYQVINQSVVNDDETVRYEAIHENKIGNFYYRFLMFYKKSDEIKSNISGKQIFEEILNSVIFKAYCGDNFCQNVSCATIGCPAPETKISCPQDCQ